MSDKALVIDGVEHHPEWDWSPEYRAHVRAQDRAVFEGNPADAEQAYLEWLAKDRGITIEQARKVATSP